MSTELRENGQFSLIQTSVGNLGLGYMIHIWDTENKTDNGIVFFTNRYKAEKYYESLINDELERTRHLEQQLHYLQNEQGE